MSDTQLLIGNKTSPGKKRDENQDYLGYYRTPLGDLLLICDGMGGAAGGQMASRLAVDQIAQVFQVSSPEAGIKDTIATSFRAANDVVREASVSNSELRGMGTTCVLVLVQDGLAHVAHVGDSRAYLVRNQEAVALTKDHSVVQELLDKGGISEADALTHPDRNIITRAIGTGTDVEADILPHPIDLQTGDNLLLASDGLINCVRDDEVGSIVSSAKSAQVACSELVDLANERGGPDNITVQIVRVGDAPEHGKRRRLSGLVVGAVVFVCLAALLTWGYQTYTDAGWTPITEAVEQGEFGRAQTLIQDIVDQDPENTRALEELRDLADTTFSQGLIRYSNHQFGESEELFGLAGQAYAQLKEDERAHLADTHADRSRRMDAAVKMDEVQNWTGKGGAVERYTQLVNEVPGDTIAVNALAHIADQLEEIGESHQSQRRYAKALGRYEVSRDIWEALDAVAGDFTVRAARVKARIFECQDLVRRSDSPALGSAVEASASPHLSDGLGGKTDQEREMPEPLENRRTAADPSNSAPFADSNVATPLPQKEPVVPWPASGASTTPRESQETDQVEAADGRYEPREVINASMRNAANLRIEAYREIQNRVMNTLRDELVIINPDQTRHMVEDRSAIIFRKIESDTAATAENRRRAVRVKDIGMRKRLWGDNLKVEGWAPLESATVRDRQIVVIIVGQDHVDVFLRSGNDAEEGP